MYSLEVQDEGKVKQKPRAKGVGRSAIAQINHEKYKSCLFGDIHEDNLQYASYHRIDTSNHGIQTKEQRKISLSTLDDKRYYVDVINSRAQGHFLNASDDFKINK